jgi:hypothetical protein
MGLVEVPAMTFLIADGKGDPHTSRDYSDALEGFYSIAYALKLMSRTTLGRDYVVPPLEGLWSADDPAIFGEADKGKYQWTLMIKQPDWTTQTMFLRAMASAKTKPHLRALSKVRFERYNEGTSLQLLHVGSYDDEAPKLKHLHNEYLPEHNLTFNGRHYEIYLSDPRKTATAKLKTILRQPIKQV